MRLSIYISLFLFFSCSTDLPDQKELVDIYYQAKVRELMDQKDESCRKRAIAIAKEDVDSLIALHFNADILDTIQFPIKPIKPKSPEHIIDKVQKFEIDTTQ